MKLLYITRKYPPMVGGMENLSYALAKEFKKNTDTTLITWSGSQKYLPIVFPIFLIKAFYHLATKKITHVHLGDALLSPLGLLLKLLFNVKVTTTVCGLDITFKFPLYQFIVPKCVARLDKIICISNATLSECLKRDIPKEKCLVITPGVYPQDFQIKATRKDLEKIVGTKLEGKKVLVTVGRLVERKGVYWFIKNVFQKLEDKYIYLIIGEGSDREKIENLIKDLKVENRILLLGKVSDKDLKIIYNTADLFVMPNIPIQGDIEGFGIVALEASSTGIPVIASNMEGIKTAVINKKTGILISPKDIGEFINEINSVDKFNRKEISSLIREHYSWSNIGKNYLSKMI